MVTLPYTGFYTVKDWYWQVGSNTSQVFASSQMTYLPVTDPTYTAWLDAGNAPTKVTSPQDLYDVLVNQWLPSYFVAGMQVASSSTPSLNDTYVMDPQAQSQISGIAASIASERGLPGGQNTFVFQSHVFNEANFLNFANAAKNWVYGVYQSLSQIVLIGKGTLPAQPIIIP